MQRSETKIRIAFLVALTIVGYCSLVGTETVIHPVKAKIDPVRPPPLHNQVYIVTKVLGIQEGDADASTMEVTFAQELEKGFSDLGELNRVKRSYKKFEETELCKDQMCDIVAIKEHQRNYELHVICPNHPKAKRSGALEEIPCAENLPRRTCRKLVLLSSVRAITAHDAAYHRRSR